MIKKRRLDQRWGVAKKMGLIGLVLLNDLPFIVGLDFDAYHRIFKDVQSVWPSSMRSSILRSPSIKSSINIPSSGSAISSWLKPGTK